MMPMSLSVSSKSKSFPELPALVRSRGVDTKQWQRQWQYQLLLIVERLWINFQARAEQMTHEWVKQHAGHQFQVAAIGFTMPEIHPATNLARTITENFKSVYCGIQLDDMSDSHMLVKFDLLCGFGSILRDVREMEVRHARVCRPMDMLGEHMLGAGDCETWEEFTWLYHLDGNIQLSDADRSYIKAGWDRIEPEVEHEPPKWTLPKVNLKFGDCSRAI